jgi:hypothetical protein
VNALASALNRTQFAIADDRPRVEARA